MQLVQYRVWCDTWLVANYPVFDAATDYGAECKTCNKTVHELLTKDVEAQVLDAEECTQMYTVLQTKLSLLLSIRAVVVTDDSEAEKKRVKDSVNINTSVIVFPFPHIISSMIDDDEGESGFHSCSFVVTSTSFLCSCPCMPSSCF